MSIEAFAYVSNMTEGISRSEKLLLLIVADHHNPSYNNAAWPSIDRIAERSMMTARNATRLINRLEKVGILAVERRDGKTNLYRFPGLGGDTRVRGDILSGVTPVSGGDDISRGTNRKEPLLDDEQKAHSPEQFRKTYESAVAQLGLASHVRNPELYWADFKAPGDCPNSEQVSAALAFCQNLRGQNRRDRSPMIMPAPTYWPGLLQAIESAIGVKTSVLRFAVQTMMNETHRTPGTAEWENLPVFLASFPTDWQQAIQLELSREPV